MGSGRTRGEDAMTTASTIAGLDQAPTKHQKLINWVREVAELTKPDRVEWCDGSDEEWDRLTSMMVEAGTFKRLNPDKRPNSFYAASNPGDVARVRSSVKAARPPVRVEPLEGAGLDHHRGQAVPLLIRAVTPLHPVGLGELGHLAHPVDQLLVLGGSLVETSDCRRGSHGILSSGSPRAHSRQTPTIGLAIG